MRTVKRDKEEVELMRDNVQIINSREEESKVGQVTTEEQCGGGRSKVKEEGGGGRVEVTGPGHSGTAPPQRKPHECPLHVPSISLVTLLRRKMSQEGY
ncbi:hypothetical protein Pmani_033152, partial [Petrolisthes manimaculis]